MSTDWGKIFDGYGIKKVTKTDKEKGAYVPSKPQRAAIEGAGTQPASVRPAPDFDIVVLSDDKVKIVKASYYYSERSKEAKRPPEPRMGHEFISTWLKQGDDVLIGNVGSQVFAMKVRHVAATDDELATEVVRRASKRTIFEKAKLAKGKPAKRASQRDDFVRNPYVVAAAILRSGGKCEMPGCSRDLFVKDDNVPYLEVHHVTPLAENGDDTLINAAALCPHCHREQHFGKARKAKRATLGRHIATLMA